MIFEETRTGLGLGELVRKLALVLLSLLVVLLDQLPPREEWQAQSLGLVHHPLGNSRGRHPSPS